MIETLKETVRKRSMETKFYGRPQGVEKYPKFPMPGPYKQRSNRTWRATLEPDISDDNDLLAEDMFDFESGDEEDALAPFDDFDVDEEQPSGSEKDSNQRVEDDGSHDEDGGTTLVDNPLAADDLVPELEGKSHPMHSVVITKIMLTFQQCVSTLPRTYLSRVGMATRKPSSAVWTTIISWGMFSFAPAEFRMTSTPTQQLTTPFATMT